MAGQSVQVVEQGADQHSFRLNEDALRSVLLREDIKDRSVVVISVAGAFRKGKSFLLGFFLRYLHHKYTLGRTGGEWLGSETGPLRGFSWRGGAERDTTGLLLWSQPFKTTLKNGEKVVIFLMDTQGTFDSNSIVRDCATVFALSTMLSSVQIYNLSQDIREDDLQHLQLFTEYARLAAAEADGRQAKSTEANGKPFQRLQFLVRDWSFPYEYGYGADGGNKLLDKRLEVHAGQHRELQALRNHIGASFKELECFLMPHPGLRVATKRDFNGSLADIEPEFKRYLLELVPMLLAPENLVLKRINGQTVRAQDMMHYFQAYMNIFTANELPEPTTVLKATAKANNLSAVAEAKDLYNTLMEEVCGGSKPYLQPKRLEEEHLRAKNKALHAFRIKLKMGGDELARGYEANLIKELEEKFVQLRAHNQGKNSSVLEWIVTSSAVLLAAAVVSVLTH